MTKTLRAVERAVLRTALKEYLRLRKLNWNRTYLGDGARTHWDACREYAAAQRRRKP